MAQQAGPGARPYGEPGPARPRTRPPAPRRAGAAAGRGARATWRGLEGAFGGPARARVIVLLACVLALSGADAATVGTSAAELRHALHIDNTDIGLLVSVAAVVGAVASLPFGVLVDRINRTGLLACSMLIWGGAMIAGASVSSFGLLLITRLFLGAGTAVAFPAVASLVGDYFPAGERGRIYGYVLSGELLGAGVGFVVTGDIAALSWRAAFVVLAVPSFLLAWAFRKLPEPARGGASRLAPGAERIVGRRDLARSGQNGRPRAASPGDTLPLPEVTDAQRLAAERGIEADPALILREDPRKMSLLSAARYVLSVKTNVALIVSGACGYFFLTGVQTFGLEFATGQYHLATVLANLLILVVGVGAVGGVLCGGQIGDALVRKGRLSGRVLVAGVSALLAVALFIPALTTGGTETALPYITAAGFCLTAQNAPLDAARLDIMPPLLWGRAEGVRTFLRTGAQALAPLAFGGLSDLLGGNHHGLQLTFLIMLAPMAVSGLVLLRGIRHYPKDVATAAASA